MTRNYQFFQYVCYISVLLAVFGVIEKPARAQSQLSHNARVLTFPEKGEVRVSFQTGGSVGGTAKIERKNSNKTEIQLKIAHLPPVASIGSEYTAIVLWAVTEDGKTEKLAEVETEEVKIEPPLQSFALMLTAEPYGAVYRPSGKIMAITDKPEAEFASYVKDAVVEFQTDTGDCLREVFYTAPPDPKKKIRIPLLLAGARRAVSRARCEGSELYPESIPSYNLAVNRLLEAETMTLSKNSSDDQRDLLARQAAALAAKAQNLAEKGREKKNFEAKFTSQITDLVKKSETCENSQKYFEGQWRSEQDERERLARANQSLSTNIGQFEKQSIELTAENERLSKENRSLKQRFGYLELSAALKDFGEMSGDGSKTIFISWRENLPVALSKPDFSPEKTTKIEELLAKGANSKNYKVKIDVTYEGTADPEIWEDTSNMRIAALKEAAAASGLNAGSFQIQKHLDLTPPSADKKKDKPIVTETIKVTFEILDS